jgi:DNA-binding CsgD family transcriptional regulator
MMGMSIVLYHGERSGIDTLAFQQFCDKNPFHNFLPLIASNATPLTKRQEDCLFYLTIGMTKKEIAKNTQLSPKTVEHYLDAVKIKLNCHNRSELIKKALNMICIQHRLKVYLNNN